MIGGHWYVAHNRDFMGLPYKWEIEALEAEGVYYV
jgi:hypothetical protein